MAMFSDAVINLFFNSKQALKDIDSFKNKTKNAFADVAGGVVRGIGSVAGAYFGVKALKGVYDNMKDVVNLSDKWGRNSEEISKFQNTLSMFGGSTQEAIENIEHLETALMELRTTGGGALKEIANKMRLKAVKEDGSFLTSLELIEKIREGLSGLNQAGKIKALTSMGLTSPATIRMLTATTKEYKKMQSQALDFGVVNRDNANQIREMTQTVSALKHSFTSLFGEILLAIKPILDVLTFIMKKFMLLPLFIRKTIALLGSIAAILATFGRLGFVISKLGIVFTWIGKLLLFIKTAIVTVVGGVSGIAVAVVAVIAGVVYAIYKYWDEIKSFFSYLWDGIVAGGKWAINQLSHLWDFLTNIDLSSAWKTITEFFARVGSYITETITNGIISAFSYVTDKLGGIGRYIAKSFGFNVDKPTVESVPVNTKRATAPEIRSREYYSNSRGIVSSGGGVGGQSVTNNANRNITIENITVNATDGSDFGEKFLQKLNAQTATGLQY